MLTTWKPCIILGLTAVLGLGASHGNELGSSPLLLSETTEVARATPQEPSALVATKTGVELSSPRHAASFAADGLRFVPKRGPEWRWELSAISGVEDLDLTVRPGVADSNTVANTSSRSPR